MRQLFYCSCFCLAMFFLSCKNKPEKKDRDNPRYKYLSVMVERGKSEAALPMLQKRLAETNDSGYIYALCAEAYLNLEMDAEALVCADDAVRKDPTYYFGYSMRGKAYYCLGKYSKALLDYRKASYKLHFILQPFAFMASGREKRSCSKGHFFLYI